MCDICKDAGWYKFDVEYDSPLFGQLQRCECQQGGDAERLRARLRARSGLGGIATVRFADLSRQLPEQGALLATAQAFAEAPDGQALILAGPPGTGKTTVAMAVGNALMDAGRAVWFAPVPDLISQMRAAKSQEYGQRYEALRQELAAADLLILDDLGAESTTPAAHEILYMLIDDRYRAAQLGARRSLIITTNLDIPHPRLDERVNSRLQDRAWAIVPRVGSVDVRPLRDQLRQGQAAGYGGVYGY